MTTEPSFLYIAFLVLGVIVKYWAIGLGITMGVFTVGWMLDIRDRLRRTR